MMTKDQELLAEMMEEQKLCLSIKDEILQFFETKQVPPSTVCNTLMMSILQVTLQYATDPATVIERLIDQLNRALEAVKATKDLVVGRTVDDEAMKDYLKRTKN